MKKIILITSVAFGIFALLQAKSWQMTYNSHGLIADEINSMKLTKYVNPGMGGFNQVWDFTNLHVTKDFEGTIENSVYSKNYNEMLSTNVVLKEFSNQFYFKGDENSLELYGVAVKDKLIYKYNKPFVKMQYPFGYGDSFSGTYGGEYLTNNVTGNIDGTYSVEADGYGTLLLPNNLTVENVLRVKTTRNYIKTVNKRDYNISIVTYRWYSENERFPLLVLIENGFDNNSKVSKSYQAAYRSDLNLLAQPASVSKNLVNNSFNIYPNPIASNATINFSVINNSDVVFDIYSINGEKLMTIVNQKYNAGSYSIPISKAALSIPAGSYYLKIQLGNEFSSQKIIIQ
ncbi:T9SS type A sorting domain-containing protein [Bacteroidota bacterium]